MSSAPLTAERPTARWRLPLAATGIAVLLGGIGYLAGLGWPAWFVEPRFEAAAPAGCDPHPGPCTAQFDARRFIRLSIPGDRPRATQPLRLLIDTAGFAAEAVTVEFSGIDMNMGWISVDIPASGNGSFTGNATLPACVRRRMAWRAMITARGPDGIHQATYAFEVNRP